tara:strand:- start:58011 stop:58991 length:981 start_codon:yes stop_codon:yes gene_type:complete
MRWLIFIVLLSGGVSCSQNKNVKPKTLNIPKGFDYPKTPNNNAITFEKIALGKKLFFDTRLSKNNTISCSSCHNPALAFADSLTVSKGVNGRLGSRNAPSLINVAYKPVFHADGGVRTLELQVLAPLIDSTEMGSDFTLILEMLRSDSAYLTLFKKAFDTIPTVFGITRAIASYERSLIQGNSTYDQYKNGNRDALNASQLNGLKLFESDSLNCTACHNGTLFTNFTYQNIGLPILAADSGRARITMKHADAGKFMVPSLRNVALTAPYMHNGSFTNLSEVLRYFENGGGNHWNKSNLLHSYQLTAIERADLLHFLESLSENPITY